MLVVLGFCCFPLISIRFVDQLGWAAVVVGFALGLRQFVQQGLGIFGGAIADRFGAETHDCYWNAITCQWFCGDGSGHDPWVLWIILRPFSTGWNLV